MKKNCELCKNRGARMYCDSDQASLCWECDERVHTANFLVAKHSRNLLCHLCQSVTQWKASGSKFGPTFSVCQICFINNEAGSPGSGSSVRRDQDQDQEGETTTTTERRNGVVSDDEEYSEEDDSEEEDDDEIEDDEEDGENQVVPWTTPLPSAAAAATTSSSEIGSLYNNNTGAGVDSDLKRFRENTLTPDSEDEDGCCSSQVNIAAGVSNSTRLIGRSVGHSQQRWDSEGKRVRRMDATSSFMRFQER